MTKHTWTEQDDLIILYIYKFGIANSPLNKQAIANKIGVSLGSVNYRIANFKAIDGIGHATHIAKLSLDVHRKYSAYTDIELKKLAFGKI